MTLRNSGAPEGEPVRPDPAAALSLEEILKPFAGLSQLLTPHEFKTLDDLNRLIGKVSEELEAMREDRLNDGRALGPLQVDLRDTKLLRVATSQTSVQLPRIALISFLPPRILYGALTLSLSACCAGND